METIKVKNVLLASTILVVTTIAFLALMVACSPVPQGVDAARLYVPTSTPTPYSILGTECDRMDSGCPADTIFGPGVVSTRYFRLASINWRDDEPYYTGRALGTTSQATLSMAKYLQDTYGYGITPIFIVRTSPDWASKPISTPSGYIHYACQKPTRENNVYFGQYIVWLERQMVDLGLRQPFYLEIWNEPNAPANSDGTVGCFGDVPTDPIHYYSYRGEAARAAISYTEMMKVVSATLVETGERDRVKLLGPAIYGGGSEAVWCTQSDGAFVGALITTNLQAHIDAFTIHAYGTISKTGNINDTDCHDYAGQPYTDYVYRHLVKRLRKPGKVMMTEAGYMDFLTYPATAAERITQSNMLQIMYTYALSASHHITLPLTGFIYWRSEYEHYEDGNPWQTEMFDVNLVPNTIYTTYMNFTPSAPYEPPPPPPPPPTP